MTNPVKYAEETLDVHGPWREAQALLTEQENLSSQIVSIRHAIRGSEDTLREREFDLLNDALVTSQSSATARKEAHKQITATDFQCTEARTIISTYKNSLEESEARLHFIERKLHVLTARMNELGGLLQFYAAAKLASSAPVQA